ncbi:lactonase family protein [Proteiniclasticum ruminis]|uniref:6-phosphogluconolactonase n=1 Tax=Proteiniclasticum ruminis TaxID=398199 RepID=A0A1I5AH27_9CLOT|nr:lactonase family protein [Proteiniclasticum ruminis]SFN61781.1 6-phosphogluconolactonase [Proteiniclasticum ruminis]
MKDYKGYIGSYTRKESRGVRAFHFNEEEFVIEDFYEVEDPSYLALSSDMNILYGSMRDGSSHGVFSMNLTTGIVDKVLFEKENTPCHISTFEDRLLASNYHQGLLDLYALEEGMVRRRLDQAAHEGSGPNEKRQEGPHVHFAMKNPHQSEVLVCDLGTDKVYRYEASDELKKVGELLLPNGSGPRHIAFSKKHPYLYVFTELSSEIFVYDFKDGDYQLKQVVKTLPEDFQGENTGAAIRLSPDEKHLYVSNRGHDSISAFKIKENHQLEKIGTYQTEGEHPRDFNLSPDGCFLLVAHMITNDLSLFRIDKQNGELTLLKKGIRTPEPISIVFLEKES